MVNQSDYSQPEVQACFSVMVEVMTILGEFRDNIVIIGGNVPPLLIPSAKDIHPGTLDIDLAIDYKNISDTTYKTIVESLIARNYYQNKNEQPFIFYRDVDTQSGEKITVQIDLLAGEYGGTGKQHRHQKLQDTQLRKARGCDLVFENPIKINLRGTLPNGAINEVIVKIPSIGPFLATKGMALWERMKEKDAYDIYFCCRYYPGGLEAIYRDITPLSANKLLREGLGKIRSKFTDVSATGPVYVADFMELRDRDERLRIQREAFELINRLMEYLDIKPFSEM